MICLITLTDRETNKQGRCVWYFRQTDRLTDEVDMYGRVDRRTERITEGRTDEADIFGRFNGQTDRRTILICMVFLSLQRHFRKFAISVNHNSRLNNESIPRALISPQLFQFLETANPTGMASAPAPAWHRHWHGTGTGVAARRIHYCICVLHLHARVRTKALPYSEATCTRGLHVDEACQHAAG